MSPISSIHDFINRDACTKAAKNIYNAIDSERDSLDVYHRVHFFERASLCRLCDPVEYICDIAEIYPDTVQEIARYIEDQDYRPIIDKYIIPTYKDNPSKQNQYEYFLDLKDKSTMLYLAIGVLCERASIIIRNLSEVGPNLQQRISGILDKWGVTWMLDFADHNGRLWRKSPTYFINSLFYTMYVTKAFTGNDCTGGENYNKLQNVMHLFTDVEILKSMYSEPGNIYTHMYGVTHIVIQLSDFYRRRVYDRHDLAKVLKTFLKDHPIDFNTYIDLYNECNLCLRLLGESADPWVTEMNLESPIISPFVPSLNTNYESAVPDLKHEHTYSLFLMEYMMKI